jgi:hypothetical protein
MSKSFFEQDILSSGDRGVEPANYFARGRSWTGGRKYLHSRPSFRFTKRGRCMKLMLLFDGINL